MRWQPWGLALLVLVGCSPLAHQVNNDLFARLTVDRKARLFDAEAEVEVARDLRQEMLDMARSLRQERQAASLEMDAAADLADSSDVRVRQQVARDTAAVWQARLGYLQAARDYIGARVRAQDAAILAAAAKFELAKALALQRLKLAAPGDYPIAAFEQQVTAMQQRAAEALLEVQAPRAQAERARNDWLQRRNALLGSSLQVDGLTAADVQPVWELW